VVFLVDREDIGRRFTSEGTAIEVGTNSVVFPIYIDMGVTRRAYIG